LNFRRETSQTQDFFADFLASMFNLTTFQVLINENSKFKTFQDLSEPRKPWTP